jgi:chorismate mutase
MSREVRAIRGATQIVEDSIEQIESATVELMLEILRQNDLATSDLISVIFTATPDIHANFPAAAARLVGLGEVPLICAQELDVANALPLVIRAMVHCNTSRPQSEIKHVYLHGAKVLRKDLAQ